jgi:Putative DNA-binding domain
MAADSVLVVVDGDLSDEKLSDLISRRTEYPELDYKATVDLSSQDKRELLELVKDIGAMQVRGGYILVGVDDNGSITGSMNEVDTRPFDEASLTSKVARYLTGPLAISSRVTKREGQVVVAICVKPHPDGCSFFKVDGEYGVDGDRVCVFHEGDAYCRIGTKSTRLTQHGFEEIFERRLARAKREWIEEQAVLRRDEITELQAATRNSDLASAPLGSVTLDMATSDLTLACLEFLRRNDRIALQHLLNDGLKRSRLFFGNGDLVGIDDLLDTLVCLAATFLSYDEGVWLDRLIKVLVRIYGLPFEETDPKVFGYSSRLDPADLAPKLWLTILQRVFALGALAVREERWAAVHALVTQLPTKLAEDGYEVNWLRHGITMASRADQLKEEDDDGRVKSLSLLSLAKGTIEHLACLHPDLNETDADPMFTSLAQFDFLFNVVAIGDAESIDGKAFYPSFARLRQERIQPTAERLLKDTEMKTALFPDDDQLLAIALGQIGQRASHEGWAYDGFDGWGDSPVGKFIETHASKVT